MFTLTKHHDPMIIPHQTPDPMACLTAACAACFRLASAVACAALAARSCAAKGSWGAKQRGCGGGEPVEFVGQKMMISPTMDWFKGKS